MINVGDVKRGVTVALDGQLFTVMDFEHIKAARGGAIVRLKLRNVRSGYTFERTFSGGEKLRRVDLDRRKVQYLYRDDNLYYFMDTTTFDQVMVSADQLGSDVNYLKEGLVVDMFAYNDEPMAIELPVTVELRVAETEPGFRGDTATGATKPAILETGMKVSVPLFVNVGDVLKVDTRTGDYIERVS